MSNKSGLNRDERVFHRIRCSYQKFKGELVITNKGIVFLKATCFTGSGRERLHFFSFDEIQGLRTEKKGFTKHNIAIDHRSLAWGNRTYRYFCSQRDANQFLGAVELQKIHLDAPSEIETRILSLVKPKGEANLHEIAKDLTIQKLVTRLYGSKAMNQSQIFDYVKKITINLITQGKLDGIITDDNQYISNTLLARKSVQYQVIVDFNSLHSQLENKGIVLQTLECPSCNGKLEYPKEGDTINCQFCGATVHALDIFKKFKELL